MDTENLTFADNLPALGLYIHIPWCVRKCPYCDFNSHEQRDALPEKDYVQALLADLEHDLEHIHGRTIASVFIGGGTPSLFDPVQIDALVTGLGARLRLATDCEITLEANPGTAEQQKFAEFHAVGINRLSIGVQSFDDDLLQRIGRIHDRRAAIRAVEMAHDAGFERINIDLMFGLPQQNLQQSAQDLHNAIALEPGHLSWYQLTVEPNTHFYHHPPTLADDDSLWDMQQRGQAILAQQGYDQYEISAYSRNQPCTHNLNYWTFGDYLGIGAGAHAKLSEPGLASIRRLQRCRHPRDYLQRAPTRQVISQVRELDTQDRALEFMMNALRLNQGLSIEHFSQHTGLGRGHIDQPLQQAIEQGLMVEQVDLIQATARGHQYLNELLTLFMDNSA